MKLRGLLAFVLSLSLAMFAGSALAGKSDKSDKSAKSVKTEQSVKSDKSAKSAKSEKSAKSAKGPKSSKPGLGLGHCKSNKGKGHGKGKGKGHERDENCDDTPPPPPPLTCTVDVVYSLNQIEMGVDEITGDPILVTESVNVTGNICSEDPVIVDEYRVDYFIEFEGLTCTHEPPLDGPDSEVGARVETDTEFWYPIDIVLVCNETDPV